jgi:Rieske Fe-S protein
VTLTLTAVAAVLGIPRGAQVLVARLGSASGAHGAAASYPVPSADGVVIDKPREVILVRWQGAVYAFRLSCPHQKTALKWRDKDGRFQCPKHKSRYQPDGTFISGRATRGMDRYAIARAGDSVRVDLDRFYQQDKDAAGWNAAMVKV